MVSIRTLLAQRVVHGFEELEAEVELRGGALEVAVLVKSELLLSVSVSPPFLRTITCEVEGDA